MGTEGGHSPRLGSAPGLPLTCPPHGPFLQRRGLHLEVEQLGQDGGVVATAVQVGQRQGPATAPLSDGVGAPLGTRPPSALTWPQQRAAPWAAGGWAWGGNGATGSNWEALGEEPGCFPWRGAEPCLPQLGLTLHMGARLHPTGPLGLGWASAAAAPPPAAPGAGTALRGGRTDHPRNHSPITPKPPPAPTCSLLLQLLRPGPDFSHVVPVGFQQLRCPRMPLAGLSLRHRGRQEPHRAGDKVHTPCG